MAVIASYTKTHCPYCGGTQSGQSRYLYRVISLNSETSTNKKDELKVVEIYCADCLRTLGLYPVSR